MRKPLLALVAVLFILAVGAWRAAAGMQSYLVNGSDSAWRYGVGLPAGYYDPANQLWFAAQLCVLVAMGVVVVLVLVEAWPTISGTLGARVIKIGLQEARPRPTRWIANLRRWVDQKERDQPPS